MTKSDWLVIAQITIPTVASLCQPWLVKIVNQEKNQPNTSPEVKKQRNLALIIAAWLERVSESNWFIFGQLVAIPIDGWILIRELNKTTPMTRDSVLLIAETVAGIALALIYANIYLLNRTDRRLTQTTSRLLDLYLLNRARIETLEQPLVSPEVEKVSPRTLPRLLTAIRHVLGE